MSTNTVSNNEYLKKHRFADSYDVIVVGGGVGGLSGALNAAKRGKSVLVLEQHNLPGGFATSFVRGKYEWEATVHEIFCIDDPDKAGPTRIELDELGVDYDLRRVPEAYTLVCPSKGIDISIPTNVEGAIDTIDRAVPGYLKEVARYFKVTGQFYNGINYFNDCVNKGTKPNVFTFVKNYPYLIRYASKTVKEVEKDFKLPEKIWDIIYAYWCYLGPALDEETFVQWAYAFYGYISTGAYVPGRRSYDFVRAFEDAIRKNGGQVEMNCRVNKIHVKDGKIQGVSLYDGTFIKTHYIMCNTHAETVYAKMIEPKSEVPEFSIKKTNANVNSCSAITLYLGLKCNPKDIGIDKYDYFIADTTDTAVVHDSWYTLDKTKLVSAICLDSAVPGTTGDGICQISITGLLMGEEWKKVTPENYFEIKDRMAKELLDMWLNGTGIDIRPYIEEVEMCTPETWSRYASAYQGQVFGYEQSPWNSLLTRNLAADDEQKKEIHGLFYVGGPSNIGHGYGGSIKSGAQVIAKIEKEMEEDN
ncbi:MAG: phytoene desaturase family protein [Acutalibacteraceae bacterium]